MDKTQYLAEYVEEIQAKIACLESANLDLIKENTMFSNAFFFNPDPISISNLKTDCYIEVNQAFLDFTGLKRSEVIGRSYLDFKFWMHKEEFDLAADILTKNRSVRDLEVQLKTALGTVKTVLLSGEVFKFGQDLYLVSITKDITERKIAEEILRESERRIRSIFDNLKLLAVITDRNNNIEYCNDYFLKTLGYQLEEITGANWFDNLVPESIRELERNKVKNCVDRKLALDYEESITLTKSGDTKTIMWNNTVLFDHNGEVSGIASIGNDLTERKAYENEVRYLNFHDKLTGLYNRAYFENIIKELNLENKLPLALIIGDVNGLKLTNDTMGNNVGDAVLNKVAKILKDSCREQDVVFRWGGDEFIILLPQCSQSEALEIHNLIKKRCKYNHDFIEFPISLSLGVAVKDDIKNMEIEDLIKEAEEKMYRNKLLDNRSIRSSFVNSLSEALLARSHETTEHCMRIKNTAHMIGKKLNLSYSDLDNLTLLASLHDIGKIAIPINILEKKTRLTSKEREIMMRHTEIGYRIASSLSEIAPIADAILYHHEWWDGSGYPLNVKGENIPLISRIIAVCDAFDVMTNGRPYQKKKTYEEAIAELKLMAGSQFDPHIVEIFCGLMVSF
jgi:diguanylate cyclase (GGDEF)-like protein/PAS domain S-box-containing protein